MSGKTDLMIGWVEDRVRQVLGMEGAEVTVYMRPDTYLRHDWSGLSCDVSLVADDDQEFEGAVVISVDFPLGE